eukprot:CAMPEP_0170590360 /NCGR_PEP_ID=MMETSP0224-20130122/11830_1 /TAXON_ID=285029 /ORGANISM="Togula jolla, Strain CCCM 725" /LENGTH=335 /DNA_ID=CAMNT_0010914155 /DNA_START=67 /DNA_END=1074 /DNA_ORIENTATION=-
MGGPLKKAMALVVAACSIFRASGVRTWPGPTPKSAIPMALMALEQDAQLRGLCEAVALQSACRAIGLPPGGWQPQERGTKLLREESELEAKRCLPPGKVIFMHVMKTGGLSLDAFLEASCLEHPEASCSIDRRDGTQAIKGQEGCAPSFLTTHQGISGALSEKGFENAVLFTILRDPVSRVWSFYNYLSRFYKPYQQLTLRSVFLALAKGKDLNKGLAEEERCGYCHKQISNGMTHKFSWENRTLEEAKSSMASFHLIIDIKALDRFPEIAAQKGLFPEHPSLSGKTHLTLPHTNEGIPRWGEKPDEMTAAVIRQFNDMDIALYDYAKTLPTYVS